MEIKLDQSTEVPPPQSERRISDVATNPGGVPPLLSRRAFTGLAAAAVLGSRPAKSRSAVNRDAEAAAGARTNLSSFADPTGRFDAAPGLLAAVAAAKPNQALATPMKQVYVDRGIFTFASEADLSGQNVQLIGDGGTIVPAVGPSGGSVIMASSGILHLIDLEVDGGSSQPAGATGTTFIVRVGNRAPYMSRVRIEGCKFLNCTASDNRLGTNGSKVTHVIYASGVDALELIGNSVTNCSGAAVFLSDVTSFRSSGNTWAGTDWYTFNIARNASGEVNGDMFHAYKPTGVYWGGAINTVNDRSKRRNRNVAVLNCTFSGYFSYGAIIRFASDDGISCEGNTFLRCRHGSLAKPGATLSCIRVTVRNPDGATSSDVPRNIRIRNNRAFDGLGSGSFRAFIYVNNDWYGGRNPITSTEISGNICRSPDAGQFFTHGVLVFGGMGGFEDVWIFDNDCELYLRTAKPIGGGIGIAAARESGLVNGVQLGGNSVKNLEPPSGPIQACFQIGPYVDNLSSVRPNTGTGGYYGLRTLREAGRKLQGLQNETFIDCIVPQLLDH
jgi:hypothetical protein